MQEIDINLKPSKQFLALLFIVIVSGLAILMVIPLQKWLRVLLMLLTFAYGSHSVWKYGLMQSSHSIIKIMRDSTSWQIGTREGIIPVELSGDSTVTTLLCVLRFTIPGKRIKQSCIVFQDSLKNNQYRRLLVALRM